MLDPARPLQVPETPFARIYRDHAADDVLYIVPTTPCVDFDDSDRPEFRVLLYTKREGAGCVVTGGRLSITTALRILPEQREAILRSAPPLLSGPGLPVRLVDPDWIAGRVEVRIPGVVTLEGVPTLNGGNRCAMQAGLDEFQARSLRESLESRLRGSAIVYLMTVSAASTASGAAEFTSRSLDRRDLSGAGRNVERSLRMNVQAARAIPETVELQGPLWTPGLDKRVTEIEL